VSVKRTLADNGPNVSNRGNFNFRLAPWPVLAIVVLRGIMGPMRKCVVPTSR